MSAAEVIGMHRDVTVQELMSQPVLTVEVDETLWDAWQLLFVSGLRHLVVLNEDGACLGVLSDRGILADVPVTAEHLSSRHVRDVLGMVPVVTVGPTDSPTTAARVMATNSVEVVPVVDHDRLVGILTESDVIRWLVR